MACVCCSEGSGERQPEVVEEVKEEVEEEPEEEPEGDGVEDDVVEPEVKQLKEHISKVSPLKQHSMYRATKEEVDAVKDSLLSKAGWTIQKHCRNGRVGSRALHMDKDATTLTWKKKSFLLADVLEVRLATIDQGTAVLRKSNKGINKSFSFILQDRSFDIECATEDDAFKYCSAFQALVQDAKAKARALELHEIQE